MVVNSIKRRLLQFVRIVLDLLATIFGSLIGSKQRYLPPITDPILLQPAVKLADKIKSGQLKSEQVVKAFIERGLEVQPHINAIIQDSFEQAIARAQEVDRQVAHELEGNAPKDGEPSIHSYPFLGVPFSTKDSLSVKGMFLTAGLVARKNIVANEDSVAIDLMRKSGAIFIALTNVPELVMWWDSYNKLFGRSYNPYDHSRITGGSSGGEAALIASAGSVIGVGADIGGSIRMPSFFCGIFGHKTTPEVVSTKGMCPDASAKRQKLLSIGPMCRYAADLRPMLKVIAANNGKKLLRLDEKVEINNNKQLRVFYMESSGNALTSPVQSDITDRLRAVVQFFESSGVQTKRVELKHAKYGLEIWLNAMADSSAPPMTKELANNVGEINLWWELVKSLFRASNYTICALMTCLFGYLEKLAPQASHDRVTRMREDLTKQVHELLGTDGILLFPTHPEIAPKHNQTFLKLFNVSYTTLFNPLCVAITAVPLGLSNGLPVGLQVIAGPHNDHLTISVAEQLEKEFGGWVSPSDIQC